MIKVQKHDNRKGKIPPIFWGMVVGPLRSGISCDKTNVYMGIPEAAESSHLCADGVYLRRDKEIQHKSTKDQRRQTIEVYVP